MLLMIEGGLGRLVCVRNGELLVVLVRGGFYLGRQACL